MFITFIALMLHGTNIFCAATNNPSDIEIASDSNDQQQLILQGSFSDNSNSEFSVYLSSSNIQVVLTVNTGNITIIIRNWAGATVYSDVIDTSIQTNVYISLQGLYQGSIYNLFK